MSISLEQQAGMQIYMWKPTHCIENSTYNSFSFHNIKPEHQSLSIFINGCETIEKSRDNKDIILMLTVSFTTHPGQSHPVKIHSKVCFVSDHKHVESKLLSTLSSSKDALVHDTLEHIPSFNLSLPNHLLNKKTLWPSCLIRLETKRFSARHASTNSLATYKINNEIP